jgi:hypothetical protein
MRDGKYFQMSDDENQQKKAPRQSQAELRHLKAQFMDRAKSFMDDTALGDGKQALQKFIRRVSGETEEEPPEADFDEAAEDSEIAAEGQTAYADDGDYEDYEDDDYEYEDEKPELDWSRPEYIHAGYAKPGTAFETQRTLEDAQEESMDLKFGNLSGLLSRFGSEDAVADPEAEAAQKREMDKDLFRGYMEKVYIALREQSGMAEDSLWLHPEVLTLFRGNNTDLKVLQFVMAALFAQTEDNYLLAADKAWIHELMTRSGYLLKPEIMTRHIEQSFLFPERVHRLYENLLTEPMVLSQEHLSNYEQNLAKLYIHEMGARYEADPRTVIRTLAKHWQDHAAQLQAAQQAVVPALQQYERFQTRKMASASLFEKLRRAEAEVQGHYQKLRRLAIDIEHLKAVTRFLEEEEALEKLMQFPTGPFLPEDFTEQAMNLKTLRKAFVLLQLGNRDGNRDGSQELTTKASADSSDTIPHMPAEITPVELNPVEQKHAIARAKAGEFKSLKKVFAYKCSRLLMAGSASRPSV